MEDNLYILDDNMLLAEDEFYSGIDDKIYRAWKLLREMGYDGQ